MFYCLKTLVQNYLNYLKKAAYYKVEKLNNPTLYNLYFYKDEYNFNFQSKLKVRQSMQ